MFLEWLDISGELQRLPLHADMPAVTIGRTPKCTIFTTENSVSRLHAQITWEAEGWILQDLGSSNGSFINGTRQDRGRLTPGDVARCGEVMEVRVVATAPTDEHVALRAALRQAEEVGRQAERAREEALARLQAMVEAVEALQEENERLVAAVHGTGDAIIVLERKVAVLQAVLDEKEALIDQLRTHGRAVGTSV